MVPDLARLAHAARPTQLEAKPALAVGIVATNPPTVPPLVQPIMVDQRGYVYLATDVVDVIAQAVVEKLIEFQREHLSDWDTVEADDAGTN